MGRAVAAGLVAGAVLAFVTARALSSLLFGVGPADPLGYAIGAVILIVAALAASCIPLRRATAVDPAVTLRT